MEENIIFFVLNLIFLGIMIAFLVLKMGNEGTLEETYAKEIALILDSAKPGMVIHLNMEDGIKLAEKNLGKADLGNIVKITGNIVTVRLRTDGGYSYSFFNNVNVNSYIDLTNNKEFVFVVGQGTIVKETSTLSDLITYARDNTVGNRKCSCGQSCNNYADYISKASDNNGINPVLLLSLMMQESGCDNTAVSGSSIGLMQINLDNCGRYNLNSDPVKCKNQLISSPELNIEVGAEILKEKYNTYKAGKLFDGCTKRNIVYYDWEAALRGYNGWGCGVDSQGNKLTAQDSFVEDVLSRYNELESR